MAGEHRGCGHRGEHRDGWSNTEGLACNPEINWPNPGNLWWVCSE